MASDAVAAAKAKVESLIASLNEKTDGCPMAFIVSMGSAIAAATPRPRTRASPAACSAPMHAAARAAQFYPLDRGGGGPKWRLGVGHARDPAAHSPRRPLPRGKGLLAPCGRAFFETTKPR